MGYTIGSFNLCDFNLNKKMEKTAEVLRTFDVVALQELSIDEKHIVDHLLKWLGPSWRCKSLYSEKDAKAHRYSEYYAYIWNNNKLHLVAEPRIFDDYGVGNELVRPPMVARFSPVGLIGGSFFELRLINTHIAFKRPFYVSMTDTPYRREEFRILMEEVYPRVSDKRFGFNMPAYTIMMGDYNLCIVGDPKIINDKTQRGLNHCDYVSETGRVVTTVQSMPTSLKKSKNSDVQNLDKDNAEERAAVEESKGEDDLYSQDYDHFSYDKDRFRGIGLSSPERVDVLNDLYDNNLELYTKDISDHVPIKIVLDLKHPYINVEEVEIDE